MKSENKVYQPFYIAFLALVLLLLLRWLNPHGTILGIPVKGVDILSDLRPRNEEPKTKQIVDKLETLIVSEDSVPVTKKAVRPKLQLDSIYRIQSFGTDDNSGLRKFVAAIKSSTKKKIRIAHFGDSMIEGDYITQDVRRNFQNDFGGSGVGFVPITSEAAALRQTIRCTFSKDWKDISILKKNTFLKKFGVNGNYYVPYYHTLKDSITPAKSWVKYFLPKIRKAQPTFSYANLFYCNVHHPSTVEYSTDNDSIQYKEMSNDDSLHEEKFNLNGRSEVKFSFSTTDTIAIHGISFENDSGVYVDNLSLRGHNGLYLTKLNADVLEKYAQLLHYNLLMLQYGVNAAGDTVHGFSWYEKSLVKVIEYLKKSFPETSILVISAGDKSIKEEFDYVTSPAIPRLVQAQQNAAEKTNSAFWNLYEVMGGKNSMPEWVEKGLAAEDYTHLSAKGAKIIGNLLYKALQYEIQNEQQTP